MTSTDELFKKPNLPSNKRQADVSHNPSAICSPSVQIVTDQPADQIYKVPKLSSNGNLSTIARATTKDEEDGDMVAGPELLLDQEDEVVDDDEGRFFGGGITKDAAEALDFIDEQDKDHLKVSPSGVYFEVRVWLTGIHQKPEKIDSAWLRKIALNFEKKISRNAELRAKFEDTPQKFMGSEADLDADIKALSLLSEHPILYEEFAKIGCVSSLVSLLSHENTDIAIDAIEIINELTDEDVEAEQSHWDALVDAMLEADLISLLHENISRLNEDNDSDRAGVYHVLGVLENLSSRASIAERIGKETSMIEWLVARIEIKETTIGQNKQYSAEVLAILLQSSAANQARLIESDGIDIFLQLLSPYRKRDPAKSSEEEEYVENLFDCVTCCVDGRVGKEKFIVAEGVELCLIMLREGKMSKTRALRLLDHALSGPDGAACCDKLVEAAGLKVIFTMFMKKLDSQTTEHLLGILASMLRSLPSTSAARIRLLAKFVEKDYEKLERLIKIRREYASKMSAVNREVEQERAGFSRAEQEERADEWFSRRLDAGLFSLQTVDVIIAWLVAEDTGARGQIQALLADRDETFQDVKNTLKEQLDNMNASAEDSDLQEMLTTLLQHL
ncbi:hypothetical protein MMC29_002772 [Sticta canariensis]|nr:hypothetical protein [Sticta canariensis]